MADSDAHTPLTFDNDSGARRSTWIAALILLAVVAWMGSGFFLPTADGEEAAGGPVTEPEPVAVAIRPSQAEEVTLYFQAEGQAQPDRDSMIRAEASGDVAEILVAKGEDVEGGQVIARLATTQAEADLTRAQQELDRARREFDNASSLLDRGVATADRVAEARADLASAEAQVTAAEEALESTEIAAPFAGRIETLNLDEGEYVTAGTEIGRIVDNQPLTVALQVPQQVLTRIENGQPAEVRFITGESREGRVTFVGTAAAQETRTFLAEIEVENEGGAIPAGISAEISIPTGTVEAHFITPSIVSLDPDGRLGVKAVEDGRVVFHPIEVVRAEVDGVWVTGLPTEVDLIVVGQGYVQEGEEVDARPATETAG